jgi:CheY-like chemotaxis protein
MISTAYQEPLAVLEAIRSGERYDIAIFDMHMPDIDGLKLARMIRALAFELKFSMPIVLLTSLILGAEDALTAKEIFFEVLSKPVKQSRLFDIISKALSGGRTQEQIATQGTKILDTSLVEKYPLRILLAEDNLVNQKLALTVLKKMGYIADLAANGLEVLDALERQKYDVVFMDVQMPEMDGIETTENIVKRYPVKDRPFIVAMTANAMEGDKERCLQAGMNDYVPKPIRLDAVREVIERIGRLLFNTAEN